jgi:hypothetical protein
VTIYIQEAHPIDGFVPERHTETWLMGSPERKLLIEDPRTDEERLALARRTQQELALPWPMLVDRMDDAVNKAWAAWPERLYVVDVDGTVVYRGGKGPMDFRPDELAAVLEEIAGFYGDSRGQGTHQKSP